MDRSTLRSRVAKAKKYMQTKEAPEEGAAYFNEDLLPTPPGDHYAKQESKTNVWQRWWHCILAAVIGSFILSIIVVLNSRGATRYHVGYPVYVRASSGIGGSKLYVIVRASVAIIYFATQSYYGGMITSVCLRAIFGDSWVNLPNRLPANAGIVSRDLLAFFVFWIVQFGVMFIHPTVLRHLFVVKAVYTTVALLGVLGWAVHMNGGTLGDFSFEGQVTLHGSALVWPMIQAINSVMGALCPILVNQPDVSRYATKPSQATWSQSLGILISKVLVMFVSCATTSATTQFLGKSFWNVWDLYDEILTQYWGAQARAGMFFASLGMVLAIIATNAGTNSLPVGADLSGLIPRYINIVRGQILCAILAPLCVPWKIISSAQSFLTFLGSYTVFLMPTCGIMIIDYWIIRKGNFHVPSLYTKDPGSVYSYYHGWNLRSIAAWAGGVAFTVHGIAGSLDPESVGAASKNMYKLGFLLSFAMGCFLYYVFNLVWPVSAVPGEEAVRGGTKLGFEVMARTEGFLEGESVQGIRMGFTGVEVREGEKGVGYGVKEV
ncbi:nucleobase cation symporter-1 family protein [Aspergillus stella-maris]|uniref:nucleobase cation symporter-1 family protein n=1 Tax=Aspergillus stella-maris TaxID=1810926 RepID=UPI003CCD50DB